MKRLKQLSILTMLIFVQSTFAQWAKGKGNGYFKASVWGLVADEHYTDTGDIGSNPKRLNLNVNVYGEYGLTDKLDVIAYIPFFSRVAQAEQISGATGEIRQEEESLNSIGDIDLGIRYALYKKGNYALSGTLTLGLPTGKDVGGSDGTYVTGDGEFNQLLQIDGGVSYSLFNKPAYSKISLGFNNRTNGFSDEYRYGLESGIKFYNKFWVIGRLNSINSFENGGEIAGSTGSIFASDLEFTSVGIEAAYYIKPKFGISAGVTGALSGKFVYSAPSYTAGIFYEL